MSFLANNDRNPVDKTVYDIAISIPKFTRALTNVFCKYGKLIGQKYCELAKSDVKRRIRGVSDFHSITNLSFEKLLFALDKDLYIDFMNEIKNIEKDYNFENKNGMLWGNASKTCAHITKNEGSDFINYVSLAYLVNPNAGLNTLCFNTPKAPLMMIEPEINLVSNLNGKQDFYSQCNTRFSSYIGDDNGFDLNSNARFYSGLNLFIDITGIFGFIYSKYLSFALNKNYKYIDNEDQNYCIYNCMNEWTETEDKEFHKEVDDILSKMLITSMTTLFLAEITKLQEVKFDLFSSLGNDILNSCRKTMFDDFDSKGDNLKTGMGLRNMAVDISTFLKAFAASNYNPSNREHWILCECIKYLVKYKYRTYNYLRVPINNLKHKKLLSILEVAKHNLHFLGADTIAELQEAMSCGKKAFLDMEDLKINGTYPLDNRLYNVGKDFVDILSKFIIIKKRMNDAGALNFSDGTIDRNFKPYNDYQTYMKSTYNELKTALSNIYNRMKSVTIGKRELTNSMMTRHDGRESIRNANQIVFGINTESVFEDTTSIGRDLLAQYKTVYADQSERNTYSCLPMMNKRIVDIINIYKVLGEKESVYARRNNELFEVENNTANAPLITSWLAITRTVFCNIDAPYEEVKDVIGESIEYSANSISEMSPQGNLYDINNRDNFYKNEWFDDTEKRYDKVVYNPVKSVEELRQAYEDLKERVEADKRDNESVIGGMLFSDFGGIQLAQDMTYKEMQLAETPVERIDYDEVEAFEDLRRDVDTLIADFCY